MKVCADSCERLATAVTCALPLSLMAFQFFRGVFYSLAQGMYTAVEAPVCPDPAAPAPPFTVVKAPCGRPPAFTDYTLPSKAEL